VPFYEIVYETGRMSVAEYADDAEAQSALGEQQRRATAGEMGGPNAGHPAGLVGEPTWAAERIAKVYVYDTHPNEYNPEQTMSADVLASEMTDLIHSLADENGVVAVDQVAVEARGITHPMVNERESAHDSMYKMEADREFELGAS
jgi:hypothetical protein